MDWQHHLALVTGGASFVGSHLTDALVERGAKVRIVDALSSSTFGNVRQYLIGDVINSVP